MSIQSIKKAGINTCFFLWIKIEYIQQAFSKIFKSAKSIWLTIKATG